MLGAYIPLFPGMPGPPELLVILLIAILLFGANKIPELARSSGEAIGEFQKGRQEVEEELEQMKDGDVEAEGEVGADTTADGEVGADTTADTSSTAEMEREADETTTQE